MCGKGQEVFYLSATLLDPNSGLSSSNVRKIIQDKYGFLWFATQEGLSRFDGKKFINYDNSQKSARKILSSDVTDISLDESGNYLWVLNAYAGLTKIDLRLLDVVDK